MTAVLLGLVVACAFGSGDFVGGRASARASTAAVLVVAQVCSVAGALAVSLLVHADVAWRDLYFGALAGAVNVTGLGLLYRALARHQAAVVAPVTAVVGAAVPVSWGFLTGEDAPARVVLGIVLAIGAGGLISLDPAGIERRGLAAGTAEATLAGLALGTSLVLFRETSEASGQWPVAAARGAALAVAVAALALTAARGVVTFPRRRALVLAVAAGVFDVAATALLVVAVRRELVVVVAPVASLAPAFTVLLAFALTDEQLTRSRGAGLAVALVGLVLLASA